MNKILLILFLSLTLSCSFNENSKIWKEKNQNIYDKKNVKKIFHEEKKVTTELNPTLKLNLSNKIIDDDKKEFTNNFGSLKYYGKLIKIKNYRFKKFKKDYQFHSKPLFMKDGLIFFDKKGSLIRYGPDNKIVWKKNYYKKTEKKLNPNLSFLKHGKNLLIADNLSKIYLVNLTTGALIWSKYNTYPINSDLKTFEDKFFLVDFNNTLKCFYIKDGSECWSLKTEKSFTISNKKNSIIIINENLIFSNSIGDITSVDISSGTLVWQLPTQRSNIMNKTYNFETSNLVSDGKSVYFSNNKNELYSVDFKTGTPNWINNLNSSLTPIVIDDLIFTISHEGFLFVIQKNQGNIIRINDVYKDLSLKKRKKVFPIGFKVGNNNLYLTSNNNVVTKIELESGIILKNQKISGSVLSEPFIYNESLYIVKNGSIIQYE